MILLSIARIREWSEEKSANSLYLITAMLSQFSIFSRSGLVWSCRFTKWYGKIMTREGLIFVALRLSIFTFHRVFHTHTPKHTYFRHQQQHQQRQTWHSLELDGGVSYSALRLLLSLDSTRFIGLWNQLHHHHCNAVNSWNAIFHYYLNTSTDTEMKS